MQRKYCEQEPWLLIPAKGHHESAGYCAQLCGGPNHPMILALLFVSTIIGGLVVSAAATISVATWVDDTFFWRDNQYAKLNSLHAGFTTQKFKEELGVPAFSRYSEHRRFRENTYVGREYFVQTISSRDGTVQVYSVTACGVKFRPTFEIPGGRDHGGSSGSVTLNGPVLADAAPIPTDLSYFASGATANSRFIETWSAGNPSFYKSFAWGLNDGCRSWEKTYSSLRNEEILQFPDRMMFRGSFENAPAWISIFRAAAVPNTYAETAPHFYFEQLRGQFQIGPDRILLRTIDYD